MKTQFTILALLAMAGVLFLNGCATEPERIDLEGPGGQQQEINMPKSTWTGAASGAQVNALARGVAQANRNAVTQADALAKQIQQASDNNMQQFDQVNGRLDKLQNASDRLGQVAGRALEKLEQLSAQQGTGEITLFFRIGSDKLDQVQLQRLVGFLDYLSRESHGRTVVLLSIGSASAIGYPKINKRLSMKRSEVPLPVTDECLVNVSHKFYKVTGIGDAYAPKNAPQRVAHRYQSVRVIAAYDAASLPATPES